MSEKEMLNAILEAVQKTNAELQAMKREFNERFDRIEDRLKNLEVDHSLQREDIESLSKKIDVLNKRLFEVEAKSV